MRRLLIILAVVMLLAAAAVLLLGSVGSQRQPADRDPGPRTIRPLYFDGRAKKFERLASDEQKTRALTSRWACLCFRAGDIELTPDPRFGKVYAVAIGPGSHNPWWTGPPATAAGELSTARPVRLGHWDWYGNSYKALPGWTLTDWGTVTQMNYPTLTSPPLEIDFDRHGVGIERSVGYVPSVSGRAEIHDVRRFFPVSPVIGKWVDFVIGVRWATDATGAIRVFTRCRECGDRHWILRYARTRIVTMQWGGGVMNRDGTSPTTGRTVMTLDKQGIYYGFYRQPQTLPTNRILQMGLIRAGDQAAAMAAIR